MEWVRDKLLSNFDRLEAPVLKLSSLGENEMIYLINGMIPNKKAQPVIDAWMGVQFEDNRFVKILSLQELLSKSELNSKSFPNSAEDYDISDIESNLPTAIEEAKKHIETKRDEFADEMDSKLLEQLEKLDELKSRHLGQLELDFSQEFKKMEKQREIKKIFDDYDTWIKETMEIEKEPFIQVIAVLKGGNL